MSSSKERTIIDAHCHLYDYRENRHEFLEQVDELFEALIGDYSALPRCYLLDQYLAGQTGLRVRGLVWHEFLSSDPIREVRWAQRMAENSPIPMSLVGLVNFGQDAVFQLNAADWFFGGLPLSKDTELDVPP